MDLQAIHQHSQLKIVNIIDEQIFKIQPKKIIKSSEFISVDNTTNTNIICSKEIWQD